jgi:hypothetical protein
MVLSRPSRLLDRHLPLRRGQSLHPAPTTHLARAGLTRHQRGFKHFTRPVFPSPAAARMERTAASAFPQASHPADQEPTTHARVGTGHRARTSNYTLNITSGDPPIGSSLTTCDLASHNDLHQSRDRSGIGPPRVADPVPSDSAVRRRKIARNARGCGSVGWLPVLSPKRKARGPAFGEYEVRAAGRSRPALVPARFFRVAQRTTTSSAPGKRISGPASCPSSCDRPHKQ